MPAAAAVPAPSFSPRPTEDKYPRVVEGRHNYMVHLTYRGTPGSVHLAAPGVPSPGVPNLGPGIKKLVHCTPGLKKLVYRTPGDQNFNKVRTPGPGLGRPVYRNSQVYQELSYT